MDEESSGDLANPNKVKRREIVSRLQERENVEDLGWILSEVRGRRFIWKFLETCQVFAECYTGNNTTFYNLGVRNAGLRLLVMINNNFPDAYLLMLKESKKEPLQ